MTGWLLFFLPAAFPAGMTLFNIFAWARGRTGPRFDGRVSVMVPARNEETTIENCVRSILASRHPIHEVIVYNDASEDQTGQILARIDDPRLRVIDGCGLPEGWVGKPHACHQLAKHATGDLLVFLDADTVLEPDGLSRIASLIADSSLLTAVPRQQLGSVAEQAVLPLLHLTYTSWLPQPLVHLTADPRLLAANGQILAVRRAVYDAVGGFAAVRQEVVDDMAFCRLVKSAGYRVRFADGYKISRCRMYTSAAEVWSGFSKNLYEGLGGRKSALLAVMVLYVMAFVLPYLAWPILVMFGSSMATAAAMGVIANLFTRLLLAVRYQHSPLSVLLHPLAVLILLAIAINSFLWTRRGEIRWRGRVYAARGER
jgi:chlorobactene glucosyltransferase